MGINKANSIEIEEESERKSEELHRNEKSPLPRVIDKVYGFDIHSRWSDSKAKKQHFHNS
jgi:hypothetical protein